MSGTNPNSNAVVFDKDNRTQCVYTNKTYEKHERREINGVVSEEIQIETEISENHEYTRSVQSSKSNESVQVTKTYPTPAVEYPEFVAEKEKSNLKKKPYVRLDYSTYANKIREQFQLWNMVEPDVIFSIISDSDFPTAKGTEVIEAMSNGSVQNICRSLIKDAASTNAWIITGGLDKGIDHLIGSEVKQRLVNRDKIPLAVLGISNWESLSDKKDLLKDSCGSISNPTELSLNQHHTHFLLVDSGKQMNSGCDGSLRQMVEFALRERNTNATTADPNRPLIYFLIGGSVSAFRFVERALVNRIPVIIVTGTGGAADIICETATSKDGATLDYLPEIVEKPFHQLEELLIAQGFSADEVLQVIANIKVETKLEPFFEIVEMMEKTILPEEVAQQLRSGIATLKNKATNELLAGIKDLLKTLFGSHNYISAKTQFETVNRMRAVFQQMLVVNGVPQENAKQAVDDLQPDVLNETLAKVKLVSTNLKEIRNKSQTNPLIQFDIAGKQKEGITSVIIGALKKQKCTKPSDVFMLAVDWDDEKFFRKLLLDKWKWQEHENVFMKLLEKDNYKYVKLIMEHNSNSKWLTKPEKPLKEEFEKIPSCEKLLSKIKDPESKAGNRIMGKVLFVWCIWKKMPDTALLFWKQGQDCLAMALFGYQESRKLKKALVNKKGYEQTKQQIKFFSKYTLGFVRKCYEDDNKQTHDLIIGKVKDLGDRTPLQIAVDADFKAFISEVPIQDLLNKIWIKNLKDHDYYKYVPMVLSEACPLLAPKLFEIPDDSSDDKKQNSTPADRFTGVRNYFRKVRSFIDIPLVKFSYGFISFIAYLTLFSIVLLTDFWPKISPSEIALIIWTFILLIEEAKQAIVDIREYKGNKWNYLDVSALTLYIIGFIMRVIYHGDPTICSDCLYNARIVLAFSLMIFFFRTLQFLSVYESLGPKIFMIYQLVADLVGFLLILAVFISAYGVVSNVILYPNQPLNAQLLKDVFYDAWWSVLQQFNLDDASGEKCNEKKDGTIYTDTYCSSTSYMLNRTDYQKCKEYKCPANNWIVPILLAIYSLITCIMLLNVLIAIFNSTFEAINDEQKEVSRMQRYRLIREFSSRSMVPPPLCIFTYPYFIIQELRQRRKTGFFKCLPKASENSGAEIGNIEYPSNDNDNEDVNEDQNVKKQVQANAFEKDLISAVKAWEHNVVAEFYKENKNKKGWYVARLDSATEKTDEFDETPFMQIHYSKD